MMKKTLMALSLLFISACSFAQLQSTIYANIATGANDVYTSSKVVGGGGRYGKGFTLGGFTYSKPLKKWLSIETGLLYAHYKIEQTPEFMPGKDMTPKEGSIKLLTIPVTLQVNFLRFFFVHSGITIDSQLQNNFVDNQTGLGISVGVGLKYDFHAPITVFANPYLAMHSVIGMSNEQNSEKLIESGWRFGIGYRF